MQFVEEFQYVRFQFGVGHFVLLGEIGDDFGDRASIAALENGTARFIQLENAFGKQQHSLSRNAISLNARMRRKLRTILKSERVHDWQAA